MLSCSNQGSMRWPLTRSKETVGKCLNKGEWANQRPGCQACKWMPSCAKNVCRANSKASDSFGVMGLGTVKFTCPWLMCQFTASMKVQPCSAGHCKPWACATRAASGTKPSATCQPKACAQAISWLALCAVAASVFLSLNLAWRKGKSNSGLLKLSNACCQCTRSG